jgi:hypothetical protein
MVHLIKNIICPILGRSSWSPLENKKQKKTIIKIFSFFPWSHVFPNSITIFQKRRGNFQELPAFQRHLGLSSKALRKCKNIEC